MANGVPNLLNTTFIANVQHKMSTLHTPLTNTQIDTYIVRMTSVTRRSDQHGLQDVKVRITDTFTMFGTRADLEGYGTLH